MNWGDLKQQGDLKRLLITSKELRNKAEVGTCSTSVTFIGVDT